MCIPSQKHFEEKYRWWREKSHIGFKIVFQLPIKP